MKRKLIDLKRQVEGQIAHNLPASPMDWLAAGVAVVAFVAVGTTLFRAIEILVK